MFWVAKALLEFDLEMSYVAWKPALPLCSVSALSALGLTPFWDMVGLIRSSSAFSILSIGATIGVTRLLVSVAGACSCSLIHVFSLNFDDAIGVTKISRSMKPYPYHTGRFTQQPVHQKE